MLLLSGFVADSSVLILFIVMFAGGSRDDTGDGHKPPETGVAGSGYKHFRCEAKGTTTYGGARRLPEGMLAGVVTAQCLHFTLTAFVLML